MPDFTNPAERSAIMAKIRGSGNRTTESRLICIFRDHLISGWRRNWKLPGRPDFTFPGQKLVVFVDGCFWHGCPQHLHKIRTNAEFWRKKIERNMARDREVNRELKKRGWRVFRVWEHELKPKNRKRLLYRFRRIGLLPSDG